MHKPKGKVHPICLALAMVAIMCGWQPALSQNLLRNGSFEGPVAADAPQSWAFHDFRNDDLVQGEVVGGAKIGRQALMLESPAFPADFAAFCRPVPVSDLDTQEIIFSCFFRTEEHPQALVTLATYAEDFAEREFRTPELQSESHPLGETSDWHLYTTRLELPEGAEQLVVLLRILGKGKVYWDGASVRPVGGEVQVELQEAGTIARLPDHRSVRLRVENLTERERHLNLEIEARDDEGHNRREASDCLVGPGQSRVLELVYKYDYRTPHDLTVRLRGDRPEVIHQFWEQHAPGLVDARIVRPAFRSAVLSSLPGDTIVVEGTVNATREIARTARVSAYLVGTGEEASEPQMLSDEGLTGPWRMKLSSRGMLTKQYQVDVTARVDDCEHTLSLPLTRAPHAEAETAYDARNRLWINGAPVFPLGIYRASRREDLPVIAEAGFNFTITPSRMVSYLYANAARDAGTHVVLASDTLDGQFWEHQIRKYRNHEALIGWNGIDLPDTKAVALDTLRQAYRHAETGPYPAIAEADSHHPILLALRPNSSMARFCELADIVLAWSDPVPRWPLTTVADAVRTARDAVNDQKPVWAIIQSSGYRWWNEMSPTPEPDARPPTPAEHRAMVYMALMAGADGLVYHAFALPSRGERPSYSIRRDEPELWASIVETNRQLGWLAPVLLDSEPQPIELDSESPIRAAAWEQEGARYVVAVNTNDTTSVLAFDIGASAGEEVEVLFERRSVVASASGDVGDVFQPFEVHLYQIGA